MIPLEAGGMAVRHNMTRDEDAHGRNWVLTALRRFEGPLIRYVSGLLGHDLDRAQDVVQDVFLRLCQQDQARIEPKIAEWLFKVSRNAAFDLRRRDRRMESMETLGSDQTSEAPSPATLAELNDEVSRTMRAMGSLPEKQREVLQLRFQHGLSYREIGSVTGRSENSIGVMIHTGIKNLRSKLTPRTEEAGR